MKKKTVKEVKMHKFLVFACKSQDFAQIQKKFARSHDRVTVTFRNSDGPLPLLFLTLHTYEMLPGNDPELSCDEKR